MSSLANSFDEKNSNCISTILFRHDGENMVTARRIDDTDWSLIDWRDEIGLSASPSTLFPIK